MTLHRSVGTRSIGEVIRIVVGVHPRSAVPPELLELASSQAGVVTREQVLGCGLSRHVVERLTGNDIWRLLARGVYLTAPILPTWSALCWAGVLLGGPSARLGPQASGHAVGLIQQPPHPVDILVPAERTMRRSGHWRFIREVPGARSPQTLGAPPRLPVETTVLDLCGCASEGEVIGLITTAVQRRLTTSRRLSKAMALRRRQGHRQLIANLIEDVAIGAESPLEVSYLRGVERPHALAKGNRQQRRHGYGYLSDVGYDEFALLVELDGRAGHEGVGQFRDMQRDNRFAEIEWTTLRYGWFDVVQRPCAVAAKVAAVLTARGWRGQLRPCSRCIRSARRDSAPRPRLPG